MNSNHFLSNLYGALYELIEKIEKNIEIFDKIVKDRAIRQKLLGADTIYMHTIILDISKIINSTKNDKTGLIQLKNSLPKKYKDKIEKLEKKYKKIFAKVSANRNRIIAHLDVSKSNAYWNMGLSGIEIKEIIKDYKNSFFYNRQVSDEQDLFIKNMWNALPKKGGVEQYRLSDFKKDLPKFKRICQTVKDVNKGLLTILSKTK